MELEVRGQLSDKELELLRGNLNEINKIKFKIGDIELAKHNALKEIEELRYSLKVQEEKVVKRYGKEAVIDTKTGEVKVPAGTKVGLLDKLKFTK